MGVDIIIERDEKLILCVCKAVAVEGGEYDADRETVTITGPRAKAEVELCF